MCSLFRSTFRTVILDICNSWLAWRTDFFGLWRKDCLTQSTLSSDPHGLPALFPWQRQPVVCNCWYQRLMLLGDGESLLNCHQNARWAETTDSCFTNCSTQNAFGFRVAIIALLHPRTSEKKGVGLHMRTKLEHLLFRSMWEAFFCMHFKSRNSRLKPLQSFWYTLYKFKPVYKRRMCSSYTPYDYSTCYVQTYAPKLKKLLQVEIHHSNQPAQGYICVCSWTLYGSHWSTWHQDAQMLPSFTYLTVHNHQQNQAQLSPRKSESFLVLHKQSTSKEI